MLTKAQSEISIDTNVFNSLIRAYLYKNNESEADQVYEIMKSRSLKPNANTFYNIFRHFMIEERNDEKLEKAFEKMISDNISLGPAKAAKLINEFIYFSDNLTCDNLEKMIRFFDAKSGQMSLNNYNVWLELLFARNKVTDATRFLKFIFQTFENRQSDVVKVHQVDKEAANIIECKTSLSDHCRLFLRPSETNGLTAGQNIENFNLLFPAQK